MLLRSDAGQRLEPVGVVGGSLLDCPLLHLVGNHIRRGQIQLLALLNGIFQLPVNLLGQAFLHHRIVEHVLSKDLRNFHILTHTFFLSLPLS